MVNKQIPDSVVFCRILINTLVSSPQLPSDCGVGQGKFNFTKFTKSNLVYLGFKSYLCLSHKHCILVISHNIFADDRLKNFLIALSRLMGRYMVVGDED